MRKLYAFFQHIPVGVFTEQAPTQVSFDYHSDAPATPLSLSIPRDGLANRTAAYNYLNNLLPDNEKVRQDWAVDRDLGSSDPFTLLEVYGEDVSGAVTVSANPELPKRSPQELYPVSEQWIARRVRILREDQTNWNSTDTDDPREKPRRSLGGAQGKFSLALRGETWVLPTYEVPSTHILKPPAQKHRDLDVLEHASLELARQVGVAASRSAVMSFSGQQTFVVERWDRLKGQRVHAEDLNQALGNAPSMKDHMRASTLAALLRDYSQDREFIRQLAFNVALGNTDAHAKNYSVFLSDTGVELAPLYDAAPEFFFHDRYTDRLGMSIGGATRLGEVTERRWRKFAGAAGMDGDEVYGEVHKVIRQVIERLPETLADHGITDSSRQHLIQKHVRRINAAMPA